MKNVVMQEGVVLVDETQWHEFAVKDFDVLKGKTEEEIIAFITYEMTESTSGEFIGEVTANPLGYEYNVGVYTPEEYAQLKIDEFACNTGTKEYPSENAIVMLDELVYWAIAIENCAELKGKTEEEIKDIINEVLIDGTGDTLASDFFAKAIEQDVDIDFYLSSKEI